MFQPFWYQEPVSWKTVFPWTGDGVWFWDDSRALHLFGTLFLLFLFYSVIFCISSTSDHQAFNPGGWMKEENSSSMGIREGFLGNPCTRVKMVVTISSQSGCGERRKCLHVGMMRRPLLHMISWSWFDGKEQVVSWITDLVRWCPLSFH